MKKVPGPVSGSLSRIDESAVDINRVIERFEEFISNNSHGGSVISRIRSSSAARHLITLGSVGFPEITSHIDRNEERIVTDKDLCEAWIRLLLSAGWESPASEKKPHVGDFDRQELCAWVMWAQKKGERFVYGL